MDADGPCLARPVSKQGRGLVDEDFLLVLCLNLFDEGVDFLGGQLACELGHVAFAVGDDIAQIIGGGGGGFCGDERWSAEMTALGGFSVTLRAVFHIGGVCEQARVRGWILGVGFGECERRTNEGGG